MMASAVSGVKSRRSWGMGSRPVWATHAVLGLALGGVLGLRLADPGVASGPALFGWGLDGFELACSLLCLGKAFVFPTRRWVAAFLGLAMLCWSTGDFAATAQIGAATNAPPLLAEIFYFAFFVLAYIAIVVFVRSEIRFISGPSWLDAAIAGTGAAALCAAFVFRSVLTAVGGTPSLTARNLAYPIGDLLLMALTVGAAVVMPRHGRSPWVLLSAACLLNAAGDTFALWRTLPRALAFGSVIDGFAWPAAFLLISLAVWLPPTPIDHRAVRRPLGLLLPFLAAVAGLAILLDGLYHRVGDVAVVLATATLALAGLRFLVTTRQLRLLNEQRHHQAITDDLTELGNRRYLFQMLRRFFGDLPDPRVPERTLALLYIDLNRFKEVNDSFGHAAGDELLAQIGPRFAASLRETDALIRLGGDEFAVLLFDADVEYASTVAERLVDTFDLPFALGVVRASLGASIGIAFAPADAAGPEELLARADAAMYRAKLGDRSVETYDRQLDLASDPRLLAAELEAALEGGQLTLYYQPQLDLRHCVISGAEALIRWSHPRLGDVAPAKLLAVAEETGLMPALTRFVLDTAIGQCAEWHAGGHPLKVSVNVSPSNLLEEDLISTVRYQLERHGLPASALVLEITETGVISDFERSTAVIEELSDLGVTVSIDDFGAGFTALSHLSRFAVRELKIDQAFVSRLASTDTGRDLDFVRSTIELGHSLGLSVVAEGVEDVGTLDLLVVLGCDTAQGHLISKPVPAQELSFDILLAEEHVPA